MGRLREAVKYVVPPILVDVARWVRGRLSAEAVSEWEYIPGDWDSVRLDPSVRGWNVRSVLEAYQTKWPAFLQSLEGTRPLGGSHEANKPTRITLVNHNTLMSYG